ncbi:Ni/Fe-hydrogenase cytochrome b subunit [bacterium]|nr:Ni/Fe-hydrogenase cytochrome b subunit [candidate division CSSED10-310 bacterium]
MSEHLKAAPVDRKIFTPGVIILLILMANGLFFGLKRFLFGLGAVTNLDNYYPWGIWITIDVASGVALAAGGFTTAALVEIFHREHYHALLRPALLTAMLGYTFVALGVLIDLGRFYNIWHPIVPSMWSGHSALFEVGMCVMAYVTVLYVEFIPVVTERFRNRVNWPGLLSRFNAFTEWVLKILDNTFVRVMFLFTITGVVLSCMHQSSLGTLMVLTPTKMNSLWWTPVLPLLFLLSAFSVGYPMVIVESMIASSSFKRKPEMELLSPLARIIPFLLGIYFAAKVIDWVDRSQLGRLFNGSTASNMCLVEFGLGVVLPLVMLLIPGIRRSPAGLFSAALLIVLGVVFNRINVFLTAFQPPYAEKVYFPSIGEISVTLGMVAALIFIYRLLVTLFPIIPTHVQKEKSHVPA